MPEEKKQPEGPKPKSEMEKYWGGEPYESRKLWAEMHEKEMDSILEGIAEGRPPGQQKPSSGSGSKAPSP
jgi:hypothetical protein